MHKTMSTLFGDAAESVTFQTGAEATQVAEQSGADATTIGNVIYLKDGAYAPGTARGNATIAREMTHVAQHAQGMAHTGQSNPESEEMAELVETMGADPDRTLIPNANGMATRIQRAVVQRGEKAARVGGVVLSKALLGLSGVLGPLGILWRWPLIKKNMNEYMGQTGKQKDTDRYGKGGWADFARVLAGTSEILKEILIWLSLATFITGILTAATIGAAAPAFAFFTGMTAGIAVLLALFKIYLVGHNLVRLKQAQAGTPEHTMIKHQLFIDGFDGIGALISAMLASFGVANVLGALPFKSSLGSLVAGSEGYTGALGTGVSKIVNDTVVSRPIGAITDTFKEGGKAQNTPDSVKDEDKGFMGGFSKDWRQITGPDGWGGVFKKKAPPTPSTAPTPPTTETSTETPDPGQLSLVESQLTEINNVAPRNSMGAKEDLKKSEDLDKVVTENYGTFPEAMGGLIKTEKQMVGAQDGLTSTVQQIDKGIEFDSEEEAELSKKKIEEGLTKSTQLPTIDGEGVDDSGYDGDDEREVEPVKTRSRGVRSTSAPPTLTRRSMVRRDPKKPGIGSRIKGWFAKKFGLFKSGARKLSNKLLGGLMKLLGKFTKKKGEFESGSSIVTQTLTDAQQMKSTDAQSVAKAEGFQAQSAQAKAIFDKAKQEEA
jgi:hypothetical protein